jgi:hypothetical protein
MGLMGSKVAKFIQNRTEAFAFTNNRIKLILSYLIECHRLFIEGKIVYSQSWVKQNTAIQFEDFLKFEFLEKYLIPNKHLFNSMGTNLEDLNFSAEPQKRFIDADGKQKRDKIDIFINRLGLQKAWNEADENIYFAIECKRIRKLSDFKLYVDDIGKFCNRNHTNLRLPFEGQIAFLENSKLQQSIVVDKINKLLKSSTGIVTSSFLLQIDLHRKIKCSYKSQHQKNFAKKEQFSIYHLMFDYSGVVKK